MVPTSEDMAVRVTALIEAMADEAVNRLKARVPEEYFWNGALVKAVMMEVLLDWFLGNWFPGKQEEAKLPAQGDSNTHSQADTESEQGG